MPERIEEFIDELRGVEAIDTLWSLGVLLAALVLGRVLTALVLRLVTRWIRRTDTRLDDSVADHLWGPLRWLGPVAMVRAAMPLLASPSDLRDVVTHVITLVLILILGWMTMAIVRVIEDVVKARYDIDVEDNLHARAVHTQLRGFRNIAGFVIVVLTAAFALLSFEAVRQFGVTLLASAGLASVIIGFAAQRSIATVVAGVQIAITQPIRVDDVVIVESEWGRIEEITLTYVVVRIWDLRRLVLPINYFIEKPFQNWTRVSADIMGSVFIHTDYSVPVEAVRAELGRILETEDLWDGKFWNLQVSEAREHTIELRGLVTARDASRAWDLRCNVRERLIDFIQREHPSALPRTRAELGSVTPTPVGGTGGTGGSGGSGGAGRSGGPGRTGVTGHDGVSKRSRVTKHSGVTGHDGVSRPSGTDEPG